MTWFLAIRQPFGKGKSTLVFINWVNDSKILLKNESLVILTWLCSNDETCEPGPQGLLCMPSISRLVGAVCLLFWMVTRWHGVRGGACSLKLGYFPGVADPCWGPIPSSAGRGKGVSWGLLGGPGKCLSQSWHTGAFWQKLASVFFAVSTGEAGLSIQAVKESVNV